MPVTNNLTSSSVRKFLPNKVITGAAQGIQNLSSWLYDDGMGDPWWQGTGSNPYQWILTATVDTVYHSSHLTRVPFQYTGLDITPNMWVMGATNNVVKVVSITSMTDSSIVCVVEDIDRYNTFADPSQAGLGIFNIYDNLIFFELGDDGLPVLNPLPLNTEPNIVNQVEDRFRVFNPSTEERFFQLNHRFEEGQILKMNSNTGLFEEATSSDIYIVGTVTATGPGPNFFYVSPVTKFINNLEPGLPGSAGNIINLDPITGDLTTESGTPVYIKASNAVPAFSIGSVENPTTYDGNQIKLNNVLITFSSDDGTLVSSDIVTQINAYTPNHGVIASMSSQANSITSTTKFPIASSASGTMTFVLNGATINVTQPSIIFGQGTQIGWWDIIKPINEQTFITGVAASYNSGTGFMTLHNASGGPINFVNISPASTNGSDMTVTDLLGVPASNPPGPANYLTLTRPDGGEIIISDIQGTATTDIGILSVANGTLPLALVVDRSMFASGNYIVPNVVARDELANLRTGDQVYVQSDLDGDWALYLKTASGWTKIANADSASTDAKTLQLEIDFSSTSPQILGNISAGTRIVDVSVTVETVFNGSSPVLTIGTNSVSDAIMDTRIVDLTTIGTYESNSSFVYNGTDGTDMDICVYLSATGATAGKATVIVSYL